MNKQEEDLKKYEAEIASVNKKLAEIDNQRNQLITHGRRIEGIVAYLREALAPAEAKSAEDAVPAEPVAAQ